MGLTGSVAVALSNPPPIESLRNLRSDLIIKVNRLCLAGSFHTELGWLVTVVTL